MLTNLSLKTLKKIEISMWAAFNNMEWQDGVFIAGADWQPGFGNGY